MASPTLLTITTETRRSCVLRRITYIAVVVGLALSALFLPPIADAGSRGVPSIVTEHASSADAMRLTCAQWRGLSADGTTRREAADYLLTMVRHATGVKAPGDYSPPSDADVDEMTAAIDVSCSAAESDALALVEAARVALSP